MALGSGGFRVQGLWVSGVQGLWDWGRRAWGLGDWGLGGGPGAWIVIRVSSSVVMSLCMYCCTYAVRRTAYGTELLSTCCNTVRKSDKNSYLQYTVQYLHTSTSTMYVLYIHTYEYSYTHDSASLRSVTPPASVPP